MWKFNYEVQSEIVNPASFSVLDPGSLENFMTVVFDCSQSADSQLIKPAVVKSVNGAWNDTKKNESDVLLAADVSPSMAVLIDRYKHKLRI